MIFYALLFGLRLFQADLPLSAHLALLLLPAPLSKEEERRLFVLCRKGDQSARAKLIEHNLRLVAHIVKKYYTNCREQEDLISIGTIGLIKAIDSFNIEQGARFATYAGKCLQNEILMHFRARRS